MAERVDAEGAVLDGNHTGYAGDEERPKRRGPAAPRITNRCRKRERHDRANPVNVMVLPHHEPVFLQIDNVVKGRRRLELEKQPADVRLKKPLPNVVGVILMINVLMMRPVFTRPEQHGIFKCRSTEDQREEPYAPVCLKCQVRIEPVIAERDGKPYREKHHQKEHDLKPVEPKPPDISGHQGKQDEEGADKEGTRRPVDFNEGYVAEHSRQHPIAPEVTVRRECSIFPSELACLHALGKVT